MPDGVLAPVPNPLPDNASVPVPIEEVVTFALVAAAIVEARRGAAYTETRRSGPGRRAELSTTQPLASASQVFQALWSIIVLVGSAVSLSLLGSMVSVTGTSTDRPAGSATTRPASATVTPAGSDAGTNAVL